MHPEQGLLNKRNEAQEAQQMLEGGSGVALTCSSYTGPIPAWGEVNPLNRNIRLDRERVLY